jgi:hypothetical protein
MRARGFNPVAIWHIRESTDWIKRILDLGCDYVGLAAASARSPAAADEWYERAWPHLVNGRGEPLVRVHAFGDARLPALRRYPWASADSTSWLGGGRQGLMMMPDGTRLAHTRNGSHSLSQQDVDQLDGHDADEFQSRLADWGISPSAFEDRSSFRARVARQFVSVYRFLEIQRDVRSRLPIRFRPPHRGLIIDAAGPDRRRRNSFPEEFNLYLAGHADSMPVTTYGHVLGLRNIMASFTYAPTRWVQQLRSYKVDPDQAMSGPPYARFIDTIRSFYSVPF